ncbi:MAG: haloacid dehalogenase-like hydrolase, partial [Microvirga sp.]
MTGIRTAFFTLAACIGLILCGGARAQPDPLPSWNDGPAKTAIVSFVQRIVAPGGPDFVPAEERIATFDNDGTLWTEQPMYVQAAFVLDRA